MKRQRRLVFDTILLGIVGAISALLFTWMLKWASQFFLTDLAHYRAPGLPEEGGVLKQFIGPYGMWLVPVATTLGGLISGILVFSLAPEAEGHGTDTVVKAFHHAAGSIRARVPFLKMVASAITIGSGGAAGREGPTALITAGIGSIYAKLTDRTDEEQRLLVLIGMASGLSAIFRSPIGTAFFAIEVLYSTMEFDAWALLYTLLGSIVAYAVNGMFVGFRPLFNVPELPTPTTPEYMWYLALGLAGGVVATLLPVIFYGIRDLFHRIPIPPHFKPAIGGLGIGLMALWLPQVLGGGYGWIQEAIDGRLAVSLLLTLVFAKILAFALTVSSGGSGGIFAPSLFVGGMLGGAVAGAFNQPPAPFVIVGMAAVFSGAARVPIATLIMVTEMTDGYHLLVPAALAVVTSYFVQAELSKNFKYRTMYEAQVPGRPDSPAHQVEHMEEAIRLLAKKRISVPASVSHLDIRTLLSSGIPIDLPGDKRLVIASVDAGSPCVGQLTSQCFPPEVIDDLEIVAGFRDSHTILPHSNQAVESGDRLLLIVSPNGWRYMQDYLTPIGKESVQVKSPNGRQTVQV